MSGTTGALDRIRRFGCITTTDLYRFMEFSRKDGAS